MTRRTRRGQARLRYGLLPHHIMHISVCRLAAVPYTRSDRKLTWFPSASLNLPHAPGPSNVESTGCGGALPQHAGIHPSEAGGRAGPRRGGQILRHPTIAQSASRPNSRARQSLITLTVIAAIPLSFAGGQRDSRECRNFRGRAWHRQDLACHAINTRGLLKGMRKGS